MTCPECKGITKVRDSRPREKYVYRHRECTKCGLVFSTCEISNEEYYRYKNVMGVINEVRKRLKNIDYE